MKKIFISMFAMLALLSCDTESGSVDQASDGNLSITVDLSNTDLTTSSQVVVYCNGVSSVQTVSGGTFNFDLFPDVYDFHVTNVTSSYSFEVVNSNLIATVNQDEDGNYLTSLETLYYAGVTDVILESDSKKSYTLTLSPMSADVDVTMSVSVGSLNAVNSLSTELSGVAYSWNCTKGTAVGDAVSIYPALSSASLTGSFSLIGTNGSTQYFSYTYNDNSGLSATEDFARFLSTFNSTKSDVTATFSVSAPSLSSQGGEIIDRDDDANGEITETIK